VGVANNFDRKLDPREVYEWVKSHPGVTTLETKTYFQCESKNVRVAMGELMAKNLILAAPYGRAIAWCPVVQVKGYPPVKKYRDTWVHFRDEATGKFVDKQGKFELLKAKGEEQRKSRAKKSPMTDPHANEPLIRVVSEDEDDSPFDA
jgi:hypothetical protein